MTLLGYIFFATFFILIIFLFLFLSTAQLFCNNRDNGLGFIVLDHSGLVSSLLAGSNDSNRLRSPLPYATSRAWRLVGRYAKHEADGAACHTLKIESRSFAKVESSILLRCVTDGCNLTKFTFITMIQSARSGLLETWLDGPS